MQALGSLYMGMHSTRGMLRFRCARKTMATAKGKKRKIEQENRSFNSEWTAKYFFVEQKGKANCLLCSESISSLKVSYSAAYITVFRVLMP
jgi:hypothetical protein